ncbi:MAG: flagellar export chaperone FlgN [Pirellulales bacterium]
MPGFPTDQLAELIDRKLACLSELRELGRRQAHLIADGDLTELLRLLATKQHLIAALQGIEQGLAPFRDQSPHDRRWRSPEDRRRCADKATLCRRLLAEIVQREKAGEASLARRRDDVAQQLNHVHSASRARGAYQSDSAPAPHMLDISSDTRGGS